MFRFLTAGESHGKGLTVIVEGLPAGIPVSEKYIAADMARRQVGYGRGGRMKIETDFAEILSGVRHGVTMGSPVAMWIENRDWSTGTGPDGVNWTDEMSINPTDVEYQKLTKLRPGHADTAGTLKYHQDDARNILERSSARESAARVAAGSIAKRFLEEFDIEVHSHVTCIGGVHSNYTGQFNWDLLEEAPFHQENPDGSKLAAVRCFDAEKASEMIETIDQARANGDSAGGIIQIVATGLPIGLGTHIQWDRKITTKLAGAVMSINAVKGVEFGAGFSQADLFGSQVHDVILPKDKWSKDSNKTGNGTWSRKTNNAGGVEGGMSNGEPVVINAIVKPIATIINGLETVDLHTGDFVDKAHFERSDITFVPTCAVIGEAMVACVIAESMLEKFGGDHLDETKRNYHSYLDTIIP